MDTSAVSSGPEQKDSPSVPHDPDLNVSPSVSNGATPQGLAPVTVSTPTTASAPATHSGPAPSRPNPLRTLFGALLFVAWAIATFLWVASTVHEVANGNVMAAVTAVSAIALLLLLGVMEGLEVSVIDRWQTVWPNQPPSNLAGWLAARQLFVALIVTAATLLANRSIIVVPGTSIELTNGFALSVFDLLWTTLTVLWFAQILWKHLASMNPDRYLAGLRAFAFPIVEVVRKIGVSQPGEWTADVVERWLDWPATPEELERGRPTHEMSHPRIWRELFERHRRKAPAAGQSQPEGS